ncbi:LysR family transcriptional regulator [Aquitalea magnusonii]|nr:LysR family transcriptional regulator [Aquitalea magnusonii]
MPSFRQIQYFLTVADLGGFTQAAANLFIAQSALSRQISQLEEELGFTLFEREPRGVRLTPAGVVYRDRVSTIPKTLASAAEEGLQLACGESGVLRLLHSSTFPATSLMPVLDLFVASCPKARIDLDRASSEEQVSLVANGNADVGVIRLPVLRRDSRVRFVELEAEQLWVAFPDDHSMAQKENVTVASLQHELFVSAVYRERGGLARVVTDLCLKRGYVPNTAQIVSPKTSMLNLVAAKRGIAIVPERMTTLGGTGITYVPLIDEDAKSTCAIVLPLQPTLLGQTFSDILMSNR